MKKTISVFLIIAVMIFNVNIYHVQAATNWFAVLTNAADVYVNTASPSEQSTLQLISDFLQTNGFASAIANSVSPASDDIIKYFASQIDASQANKTLQENIEAIRECVENGFTGGDSSVTFNNTLHNAIYNTANYYIEQTSGNTFYACGLQESLNSLNATIVADMAQIIEDNPNSYFILINTSPSIFFIVFKENGNKIYGVLNHTYNSSWSDFRLYQAVSENGITTSRSFTAYSSDDMVAYIYNSGTQHLDPYTVTYPWNDNFANHGYFNVIPLQDAAGSDWNRYPKAFNTVSQSILTFNSVNQLNDYISTYGIGKNPYYYNNQVWSDFSSHTSGDYTVDNSNVNTVTYGDVISYVNDYHDTNNYYPDNSTVNTWIETTNNNNNSGGGSGDDSGGGSGGSGGDSGGSGIVSILTALGKAIADLITGIAAFLAEVVGGLVEAITGLLDTLTDLITNFTESIPNIFSPLLGWLFDGLPEEFTAIILLGLTACVIASIIKILRG